MGEATFGKYRLIAELGHGGMADVFLAVMAGPIGSGFTKLTVVKRLRENLAEEQEFVEMLVDEARISARLNHPNVVQTNEIGSVGNQYFLAMEYLDGQPLHRIQHRATQARQRAAEEASSTPSATSGASGPLSLSMSKEIFPRECQYLVLIDTLAGLHYAHELADYDGTSLKIVHRDVTPHNIFVTYEGQVKVVDFGIAKAVGRASETRQGVVKGKVRYMAPEQAIGKGVDRRADIFSVGVMLWEAATGRRLWKDMDELSVVQALVANQVKISPREIDPSVPENIDRVVQKALAFDPDQRYLTADDFRLDLEQCLIESGQLASARRKLAADVCELFKDKREEIKRVIEKQLKNVNPGQFKSGTMQMVDSMTSGTGTGASHMSQIPGIGYSSGQLPPVDDPPVSQTNIGTAVQTEPPLKPKTKRTAIIASAAALAAAVAVVAIVRPGSSSETKPAASAEPTSAEQIHLKVVTVPANAQVTIDNVPTPSDALLPRDTKEHVVRVTAPGYEPAVEKVVLDKDMQMSVALAAVAPVDTTKPAAPAPAQAPAPAAIRWMPAPKSAPSPKTSAAPAAEPPPPAPAPAPAPAAPAASHTKKPRIDDVDPWKN